METTYLTAVSIGDTETVERILVRNVDKEMDINARDRYGRHALTIAIEDGNIELVKLLLKFEVEFGDALLHAVNVQCVEAVRVLCEAAVLAKEFGNDYVNKFASGPDFPPSTTPLTLAGERNHTEIMEILLENGAKMPPLEQAISCCPDTFGVSLARLTWYKAISNDSYLILACEDPIKEAFQLSKQIARVSRRWPQMKPKYDKLHENLTTFVTALLDLTINKSEIGAILGEEESIRTEQGSLKTREATISPGLKLALKEDYKLFVAHPSLQEYLLGDWYCGWHKWRELSSAKFAFLSLLIICGFPFLSVLYILIPCASFVSFMRTPYVRFLMSTASRIFLMAILIFSTLSTSVLIEAGAVHFFLNDTLAAYLAFKGPPPDILNMIVYCWIVGAFWNAVKKISRQGFITHWKNRWNWVDSLQLLLYIVYVTTNTIAYLQALKSIPDDKHEVNPAITSQTLCAESTETRSATASYVLNCNISSTTSPTHHVPDFGRFKLRLLASYNGETRLDWDSWNPLLLAEASFALANMCSFLGIMHNLVILGFVGPLQISLGRMLADIVKFLLLFSLVWVSFAIGLTQLYRTFEFLEKEMCNKEPNVECNPPSFDNFWRSLDTLFWSLFGVIKMDSIIIAPNFPNVHHNLHMTEAVGFFMYTVYLVVAVVVLLNALIAMMSTTYGRIEENAEVEWMVARTSLMTEYMCVTCATLAPPFNLIPTVKDIVLAIKKFCSFCSDCILGPQINNTKSNKEQKKASHERAITLIRTLTARYVRMRQAENARKKQNDWVSQELLNIKRTINKTSPYKRQSSAFEVHDLCEMKKK